MKMTNKTTSAAMPSGPTKGATMSCTKAIGSVLEFLIACAGASGLDGGDTPAGMRVKLRAFSL